MKRQLNRVAKTVFLFCAFSVFSSVPAHAAVSPQMRARVTNAMQELQTYNSTHSFSALRGAIETLLNSVDTHSVSAGDYVTFRRTVVQGWANILKAIEQSYDPAYDPKNPNDRPSLCVLPSQQSATCNVSPNQVQNSKERAEYAARLQANAVKVQQAQHWHNVVALDMLAMSSLQADLQLFAAAGAPSDYTALDAIFRQATITSSRMAQIDTMLAAPTTQTHLRQRILM